MKISHYQLEWHVGNNEGRIKVSAGGKAETVPVNSVEEFIAVALVLGKPDVELDSGVLKAGPLPVGS
ncbi:MAG TPA: hypothetical protein VGC13_02480 [Longimicrobium sp.]|jgi:hypothetical protein|uniref:hypothetical protein n=1 Tax=Longimicrobium sp. TaxID=2029185 RepID=UPI002EDB81E4